MTIKKAVIPVAGLGTRFLPATKALPKEMLPIVDKPAVQYIVEEAVQAGIEEILFVTSRNKEAILNHFDRSIELEQHLDAKGKWPELREVQSLASLATFQAVRQTTPLGLGHAILCAESFVGDEPFAVLLGDDLMMSEKPAIAQMMAVYEETRQSVIGVQNVRREHVHKYGIIQYAAKDKKRYEVSDLIEKPQPHQAPSTLGIMGRYVLTPSIFQDLRNIEKGEGGEYQLTDAIKSLLQRESVAAFPLLGDRYDIGYKFGYMRALIEMGMKHEDMQEEYIQLLEDVLEAQKKRVLS
ncbi:UTP--glucose-1-phosphate uridylyltransferase GalU [Halobacillus litoralis]|uniref:UTP--glucose-1-phosphate uridylyltransferase n=1 Tax=Halobacillus litoralis TaxID=45668 RepID=A0A845DR14_9BACI|nr:UTP--glucose-1-phosphate uridylyltransferase GalU [Halobacillus litoralis]MYL18822.1 UTP--glucose-1-phosphate uridylyltransferase GalU [Halobacillus litoralis]